MNIAIDGPAGAGKTTVAKLVAERLNYMYVDTGATYRAMALHLIRENVPPTNMEMMSAACENVLIDIDHTNGVQTVWLNGENVTELIRTEEVGNMASACGVNPDIREYLVKRQQVFAKRGTVIMEGRDICTHVLPDAEVKIYLTADSKVRAERRYKELVAKGIKCNLADIEKDIQERDHRDMTRETSPLKQAEDAVLIDSSDMIIDAVVNRILREVVDKTISPK